MADDKQGRDKQAHDEERRQRERELKEERERSDEAEPIIDADEELGEFLTNHEYPTTAVDLVDGLGNPEIETRTDSYTLEELFDAVDEDRFESAEEAQETLQEILERTD